MVFSPQSLQVFPPDWVNEDRWYRSVKSGSSSPPQCGREKIFAQEGGIGGGGLGGGGEGGGGVGGGGLGGGGGGLWGAFAGA